MTCPLTSIVNPLNEKEVLVFYLTANKSTGLEIHNYENIKDPIRTAFNDNIKTPPADDLIANPGSYSSLVHNGLLNVYGLVRLPFPASSASAEKAGAEVGAGDTKIIAQLSPVFKLIMTEDDSKVKGVALTTIMDGNNQAWMFTIATKENNDIPIIKAIKLGWKASSVTTTLATDTPPLLATNLASFYDRKADKSYIIYQNEKNLRIVDSGNAKDRDIPNTEDSRDYTGLACVRVPGDKGGDRIYLYYFASKGGKLQRTVRDEDGEWSGSEDRDNRKSAESTFLTATLFGDHIAVYYFEKDKPSTICSLLDPVHGPARYKEKE